MITMNKRVLYKNDLETVEEITLPNTKTIYRVVRIDSNTCLQVSEYEDLPIQYIREEKINQLLNEDSRKLE